MKKILLAALIAIFATAVNAQETISGKDLRERYLQAYEELDYYMKQMSDACNGIETRQKYMSQALSLFYGKGEPYMEDSITMPAPKFIIESNRRKVRKNVKSFFSGLVKGMYDGSKFSVADIPIPNFPIDVGINSMRQVNDSTFTLETIVSQRFSGYKEGQMTYTDVTAKKYKVYLLKKNVSGNNVFVPLLTGDIHVVMLGNSARYFSHNY